ncbi:MAG: hypothetical protein E7362_00855 [Clostridiales bacterium]|nr:hypothetical protein [Clostridiales bacterium]
MKPLTVDLPYPSIKNVENNRRISALIYPLYSGGEGELNAILQYVYHGFYFNKESEKEIKDLLESIAIAEMIHLNILGELLMQLGSNPAYYNTRTADFYSASSVSYTHTPKRMILDDIAGEIKAVKSYSDVILAVGDSDVSAILTRIKMDEELHILALKNMLEKL